MPPRFPARIRVLILLLALASPRATEAAPTAGSPVVALPDTGLFAPVARQLAAREERLSRLSSASAERVELLLATGRTDQAAREAASLRGDDPASLLARARAALAVQDFAAVAPLAARLAARSTERRGPRGALRVGVRAGRRGDHRLADAGAVAPRAAPAPRPSCSRPGGLAYDLLDYARADSLFAQRAGGGARRRARRRRAARWRSAAHLGPRAGPAEAPRLGRVARRAEAARSPRAPRPRRSRPWPTRSSGSAAPTRRSRPPSGGCACDPYHDGVALPARQRLRAARTTPQLLAAYPRRSPTATARAALAAADAALAARPARRRARGLRGGSSPRTRSWVDARVRLASLDFEEGRFAEARDGCFAALATCPEYGRAHAVLAKALESQRFAVDVHRADYERRFAAAPMPDVPGIERFVVNWNVAHPAPPEARGAVGRAVEGVRAGAGRGRRDVLHQAALHAARRVPEPGDAARPAHRLRLAPVGRRARLRRLPHRDRHRGRRAHDLRPLQHRDCTSSRTRCTACCRPTTSRAIQELLPPRQGARRRDARRLPVALRRRQRLGVLRRGRQRAGLAQARRLRPARGGARAARGAWTRTLRALVRGVLRAHRRERLATRWPTPPAATTASSAASVDEALPFYAQGAGASSPTRRPRSSRYAQRARCWADRAAAAESIATRGRRRAPGERPGAARARRRALARRTGELAPARDGLAAARAHGARRGPLPGRRRRSAATRGRWATRPRALAAFDSVLAYQSDNPEGLHGRAAALALAGRRRRGVRALRRGGARAHRRGRAAHATIARDLLLGGPRAPTRARQLDEARLLDEREPDRRGAARLGRARARRSRRRRARTSRRRWRGAPWCDLARIVGRRDRAARGGPARRRRAPGRRCASASPRGAPPEYVYRAEDRVVGAGPHAAGGRAPAAGDVRRRRRTGRRGDAVARSGTPRGGRATVVAMPNRFVSHWKAAPSCPVLGGRARRARRRRVRDRRQRPCRRPRPPGRPCAPTRDSCRRTRRARRLRPGIRWRRSSREPPGPPPKACRRR